MISRVVGRNRSLVGGEAEAEPVPLSSLEEVPLKAKVQFWPKGLYSTAVAAGEDAEPAPRKIVMLIEANELFEVAQKVVVDDARSVADLIASACEKLEQAADPNSYVLSVGGTVVVSLADVPDKAKVAIALRDATEPQAPPNTSEEATASSISFADDVDGSATTAVGSLKKSYTAGEYRGLLAPEDLVAVDAETAGARELLLLVTENDAIPHSKKLQIVASDVDELFDKVAEGLGMDEPVFVCPVASSIDEAIPFESLDGVGDKVKVSVWPARCFGMEFADAGPVDEAPRRGISFADDTGGTTTSIGSALRKSYVAGEYSGMLPPEEVVADDAIAQQGVKHANEPKRDEDGSTYGDTESPHDPTLPNIVRIAVHGADLCYERLDDGKEKSYMGYTFIVTAADGQRWRVTKRYSDFDKLKKALADDVPDVKKWVLPRKTLPGKKDSDKTIEARKDGLAKFMAGVVAVAGTHEVVRDFVTGADSTFAETVSGVGEVDEGNLAEGTEADGVDASWSASAAALEESKDSAGVSVAAVRMQDAPAAARVSAAAIDMITPVGLKLNRKVEEGLESETGLKARQSLVKGKEKAKTIAAEANEKAVKLAGYDESGSASLERLTHLNLMRKSALECYGSKSPQYLALSKKVQQEVLRLKEKEALRAAEVKREQETMIAAEETIAAAEQAAATPEQTLGGQLRANAEAMSKNFAAEHASVQDPSKADDSFANMNESTMAAMGEIADSMASPVTAQPQPSHEFVLMVTSNELVPHPRKLRIDADTLDDLCDRVAEALEITEPVFVCRPADSVDEAQPFVEFEQIGAKTKVSVWPARCFGMEEGEEEEVEDAAIENSKAADTSTEPSQEEQTMRAGDEGEPVPDTPEPGTEGESRKFMLLVTENDAIPHSKKLQIVASDVDELFDKVAEGLGMDEPVFVCPVASSIDEAIPFESLDGVGDKVKVSVWPARCFGMEFDDSDANGAVSEGIPPQIDGDEFAHRTEDFDHADDGFGELLMAEAQAVAEEEAAAAVAREVEVQRRAQGDAEVQTAEQARVAASRAQAAEDARLVAEQEAAARAQAEAEAQAAEQARLAAEQEAAARAQAEAEAQAAEDARLAAEQEAAARAQAEAAAQAAEQARVAAAVAKAAEDARLAAEQEAAARAQTESVTIASEVAASTSQGVHEQPQEVEASDARNFILMVVANDIIPKTLLRVQAGSLQELRAEISKGKPMHQII
eukprot:COSAG02_NODE_14_length_56855_cov_512.793661_19_plen_1225_part_00